MEKEANLSLSNNPKYVAEQIRDVIHVMIGRMSIEAQHRAIPNLKGKIKNLSVPEIASKRQPGGSAIGVSISLVKNILNGKDPYFIHMVINELAKEL